MGTPSPDDSGLVTVGGLLAGRYRVESVLGKGGMGRVYKAEHTGIGRAQLARHGQPGERRATDEYVGVRAG